MKKKPKRKGPKLVKIFPDSSWLISLLNKKDSNHDHIKSSFGFLTGKHATFFLSSLVILETMNGLTKNENGFTVRTAEKCIKSFFKKITLRTEKPIKLEKILHKYHQFVKNRKIRSNTTVDFYIVTEGMVLGSHILTVDKKMYKLTKPTYKNIYLISEKVKGIKSDLPRFVENIVNNSV